MSFLLVKELTVIEYKSSFFVNLRAEMSKVNFPSVTLEQKGRRPTWLDVGRDRPCYACFMKISEFRLSIFGFSSRQQFEEHFMTFLLLINKDFDENNFDVQEEFIIKSTCLQIILELLLMYKTFPIVGSKFSHFKHSTRCQPLKFDTVW